MGLFTKIKDILFEEEVDETIVPSEKKAQKDKKAPVLSKNNEIREIVLPTKEKKEEVKVEDFIDDKIKNRDVFKSDPTFPFPLAFEEDIKEVKTRSSKNTNVLDLELRKKERGLTNKNILEESVKVEEAKPFRPSPIISPVYGILDKNYKKNDIVNKEIKEKPTSKPDFDTIRKKAYGTLEDDIENTLNKKMKPIIEEEPANKTIDELLLDTLNIELTEEISLPKTVGEAEDILDETADDLVLVEENEVEEDTDTTENDLFDLIDSMYEKRKDGEQ